MAGKIKRYKIPSMADVEKIRGTNGYSMVSTFSGCGGSCLGFEMAGFDVRWASEFIPAAQEVYRLNHPETILSPKDIREVTAKSILKELGLKKGELDVFEGSPPCAAFSMAGHRHKAWGEVKKYSDKKQRVDDLFFEFARLLKGLKPKMFVAENVSGLIKGSAKGYFKEIYRTLQECGYTVTAKNLNAKWLGVPQSRERLIFIGTRKDLNITPEYPTPMNGIIPYKQALAGLKQNADDPTPVTLKEGSKMRELYNATRQGETFDKGSKRVRGVDTAFQWYRAHPDKPIPTVVQGSQCICHPTEARTLTISELKRLSAFPDDFQLTGSFQKQWERIGRAVPPLMMRSIAQAVKKTLDGIIEGE